MQVILLEQVKKLGDVGDIVEVKNGYARNFLIPGEKAIRATKDNIAYFESKKSEITKADGTKLAEAEKTAKKISDTVVVLTQQAGEDGRLYGSVSSLTIAKELSDVSGVSVDRKQVVLTDPIKYIGIYPLNIDLYGGVQARIHVNIARNENEAKEAAKRFARGETVQEGPDAAQAEEVAAQEVEAGAQENKEAASAEAPAADDSKEAAA